jgi:hypothetical protein
MDQITDRIKQLSNELKEYVETRLDLMVLNIGEQVTLWLGESIQKLIGYTVLGVGLFFGMIALAIYLGEVLGNAALGYLVTAAPLILIGFILAMAKPKGVARSIQNQFMEGILKSIDKKSSSKPEEISSTPQKQLTSGHEQKN